MQAFLPNATGDPIIDQDFILSMRYSRKVQDRASISTCHLDCPENDKGCTDTRCTIDRN